MDLYFSFLREVVMFGGSSCLCCVYVICRGLVVVFCIFLSGCLSCLTVLLFNLIWLFPAHHSIVSHFFLFAVVSTRSVFVWYGGVRGCSASHALTMVNPMPVEGAEEASQVRITGENPPLFQPFYLVLFSIIY